MYVLQYMGKPVVCILIFKQVLLLMITRLIILLDTKYENRETKFYYKKNVLVPLKYL